VSAQLIGDKQLEKLFKTLGERVQRKVLRKAVNKSATPLVKAARADAPKESGLLKKAMGKKVVTDKQRQSVTAIVGPRRNVVGQYKGKLRKPARYSHLAHNGFIDKDGNHHPGTPFLTKAQDETKGQVLDTLRDELASGVAKEAKVAS
jgi:HK97 gp10 family phage protein